MDITTHRGFLVFTTLAFGVVLTVVMWIFLLREHGGSLPFGLFVFVAAISFTGGLFGAEISWRLWTFVAKQLFDIDVRDQKKQ